MRKRNVVLAESNLKKKLNEEARYGLVHLGIGVTHHGNEKVEKEEEDNHDEETPVDLACLLKIQFFNFLILMFFVILPMYS